MPTGSGRRPPAIQSPRNSTWPLRSRLTRRQGSSSSMKLDDPSWEMPVCSSGGRRWSTLSSSTPEGGSAMAGKCNGSRRTGSVEKRGGYRSSSKPAASLKPPPPVPLLAQRSRSLRAADRARGASRDCVVAWPDRPAECRSAGPERAHHSCTGLAPTKALSGTVSRMRSMSPDRPA